MSAILVVAAVLALTAYAAEFPVGLRAALTLPFLLFCPGFAAVRLMQIPSPLLTATLALAASLVISQSVAMVAMYTDVWSTEGSLAVIAAVTCVLALLPQVLDRIATPAGGAEHGIPPR